MKTGIVGAGISGVYLASLLGRQGQKVSLFDPKTPWEKPCGGGITYRTFQSFPVLNDFQDQCLAVKKMRMFAVDGESCALVCDKPFMIASRQSLSEYLLNEALSNDVTWIQQRVVKIIPHGPKWLVFTDHETYEFDQLIGADGMKSIVRRSITGILPKEDTTLTVGYWAQGECEEEAVIGFVPGLSGYIWIFPRKGHLSIGLGAKVGEATGKELYHTLDRFLERHYPDLFALPRNPYSALIPSLSMEGIASNRICGKNWALVGDAAGWADPLTGEGIYYAFRSAQLLFDALASGQMQEYETACRKELIPELKKASSYVRTFFHPKITTRLVKLSREQSAIRKLLVRLISGDQGYMTLKQELVKSLPQITRDAMFNFFS